jgi:hypothetical protein
MQGQVGASRGQAPVERIHKMERLSCTKKNIFEILKLYLHLLQILFRIKKI